MNNLLSTLKKEFLPITLILVLVLSRIIPHPWNFTPILATGIFSGFYFKNLISGFFVVAFSMFLGDLYLGFHNTMFFTYISVSIAVGIGFYIRQFKFSQIIFSSILSSVSFFIITNFGFWLLSDIYQKSLYGLLESYLMAIPFFHNTLISTFIYLVILKLIYDFFLKKKLFRASV